MTDDGKAAASSEGGITHRAGRFALNVSDAWADPAVDIAAIVALAYITQTGASEAVVQVVAGAIGTVALGKRYLQRGA